MTLELIYRATWGIPVTLICVWLLAIVLCGIWANEDDHD